MSRSVNYNQLVGDVDDIEIILEEEEVITEGIKKMKPKKKRFDDGTSVKSNSKKNKRSRFQPKTEK